MPVQISEKAYNIIKDNLFGTNRVSLNIVLQEMDGEPARDLYKSFLKIYSDPYRGRMGPGRYLRPSIEEVKGIVGSIHEKPFFDEEMKELTRDYVLTFMGDRENHSEIGTCYKIWEMLGLGEGEFKEEVVEQAEKYEDLNECVDFLKGVGIKSDDIGEGLRQKLKCKVETTLSSIENAKILTKPTDIYSIASSANIWGFLGAEESEIGGKLEEYGDNLIKFGHYKSGKSLYEMASEHKILDKRRMKIMETKWLWKVRKNARKLFGEQEFNRTFRDDIGNIIEKQI